MTLVVVDVESDGPVPPIYSMVCFGAVIVEKDLQRTFYGQVCPISEHWKPDALAISGFTREEHLAFEDPQIVMDSFCNWLHNEIVGRPVFVSDNPCYDWQFINYYMHRYCGMNPMGFSGRRIGDIYAGFHKDLRKPWKHLRKTSHDHHPVNDAKGNAEVLIHLADAGVRGIL